ncbi:DUF2515 family protein [Caldalkalibacillus mannanilyticus]|uniref:DUF2515 family protein n=1 Tax=Caldalkalibacillus mannanilyticus TaxID=1418 RepID=UPI0009DE5693
MKKKKLPFLYEKDQILIAEINKKTSHFNRNNITRTKAYLDIFIELPELHWAFLAHMVSRNGGWSMTDLKGDLLPHLLEKEKREHFFLFLETSNAYIFQNAYPQLLLYKESLRVGRSLFHLLPVFHVSAFMLPFWEEFWESRDSSLLTLALIINEQHYIEKRIVQHPEFKQIVFNTLEFTAQSILQLTQVLLPYQETKRWLRSSSIALAGITVQRFTRLADRIEAGRKLYSILFGISSIHEGCRIFALQHRHTGSRADYWPTLFSKQDETQGGYYGKERLIKCQLKHGAPRFYSPELTVAWQDEQWREPERFDWFVDLSPLIYLEPLSLASDVDITTDFCNALNRVELAILAKQQWNKK